MQRVLAIATLMLLVNGAASSAHAQAGRGGRGGPAATPPAYPDPPALQFPTDDPVLKRIWAIGMDSSWVVKFSQPLFDSIGPRLMGSPNLKAAEDWLVKTYASMGISAKEEQYGTWRGWIRGYSHIDLISPRVRSLDGMMVGYSPGTNKKDVDAEVVILPDFTKYDAGGNSVPDSFAFVKWLPQAKGKIVMVSAAKPSCRPTSDWTTYGYPELLASRDSATRALATGFSGGRFTRGTGYSVSLGGGSLSIRLDEAKVAGIITSRPKDVTFDAMEIFKTYSTHVPTIALNCEDYSLVYRLADNHQHPVMRLNLDGTLLGEQPVYNTIARIPGGAKANEYVMLSSHFDSWDGSSGATDNGTGTVTMLEAMRILSMVLPHPQRTILSGHWSGEEEGEVGSHAFTEDHPEVIKGLQGLFNQDNGTGRVTRIGAGGIPSGAEHMSAWYKRLPNVFTEQAAFNGQPGGPAGAGSDDYSFTCYGVPTFGLGALSWDYSYETWHTDRDTYDKIVFEDLRKNATLTAMLAYMASEDPTSVVHLNVDSLRAQARGAADSIARARRDSIVMVGGDTTRSAASGRGAAGGRGGGSGGTSWPQCLKAPRTTKPRLSG